MPHHPILYQLPLSTHLDAVYLTLDHLKKKLLYMHKTGEPASAHDIQRLHGLLARFPEQSADIRHHLARFKTTPMQ